MSAQVFLDFLRAARDAPGLRARDRGRNLVQLVFHARNEGFDFTERDVATVVGALETNVIVGKDGEREGPDSTLWRHMWGVPRLDYVLDHVVARHTEDELRALIGAVRE